MVISLGTLFGAIAAIVLIGKFGQTRSDRPSTATAGDSREWTVGSTAAFAFVASAVGIAAFAAAIPVRASAVHTGPVIVETDPMPTTGPDTIAPAEMTIRLIAAGPVVMTVPTAISMAVHQGLQGVSFIGWEPSALGVGTFVSDAAVNEFVISGQFTTLDLQFTSEKSGSSISIDTEGTRTSIALDGDESGHRAVRFRSGAAREVVSSPFMWTSTDLLFSEPASAAEWSAIGLLSVDGEPILSASGEVLGVHVTAFKAAGALMLSVLDVSQLGVVAMLLLLIGFVVATALRPRLRTIDSMGFMRSAIYGLAVSMLVVGAANYLLPVRYAIWLLLPVLVVGVVRLLREHRQTGSRSALVHHPIERTSGTIVAPILVAVFHLFWFVVSGRWSIGFLQTDVFDTFNATVLFWGRSARDASIAFGDGFRLLDYTARAAVWGTMLERPSDAIVVFRLLLGVVIASLAAGLVARQGYRTWVQITVGVLGACSSAFVGLYAEGYMSREFFVSWLLIGLLCIGHQLFDDDLQYHSWWRVGAISSVSLAIVPPYFLIAPVLLLVVILGSSGSNWLSVLKGWRPAGAGVLSATLILGLPNLFWLRSSAEAAQYIDALNALVRNIIIPFYGTVRLPAAMFGLLPFHNHDGYRLGGSSYRLGPLAWDTDLFSSPYAVAAFIAIVIVLFILAVWSLLRWSRGVVDQGFAALWVASIGLYLAGLIVLRVMKWNEQTYFTIMWIWTLAPVALMGVILVFLESGRVHRKIRRHMLTGVVLLSVVNFASTLGESVLWVESPHSERAQRWHYDLVVPIDRFERALRQRAVKPPSGIFAVVIDRPSSLTGTDDDRVLTNVLVNLLEADGLYCPSCQRNADFYWVTASASTPPDVPVLLVGASSCGTRSPLYVDEWFSFCGAD